MVPDPFDALFWFQRALEQQRDIDWLENAASGTGAFPPINVFRQGGDFVAIIEMPGVSKDDLGLEVRGNTIRISGKKTVDHGSKASRRERITGSFDRTISLPVQLDPDRIMAEYRDGMLARSLPRAESDKPKAIKVNWSIAFELETVVMAPAQELEVRQKRELDEKDESTIPARVFLPNTDIFETEEALAVVMEMPGVNREHTEITVEDDVVHRE
jgi:HSP20 family protein